MRACTSPGSSRKSTPSRAFTPGKLIEMPRISTTGAGVPSGTGAVVIGPPRGCGGWCPESHVQGTKRPERGFHGRRPARSRGSVLAVRQRRLGRGLVEDRLLGQYPGRDRLAGLDLLGQVHQLVAEQRAALDDVVDLAVGQGLHAVVR